MQNKKWEKRKKRTKQRGVGAEKQKLIKKYKGGAKGAKGGKGGKGGDSRGKPKLKAPKMMKIRGKRTQKK